MLGVFVALSIFAGFPPTSDPTTLVGELGSARYLERELAEASLTRLGRAALPALRAASVAKDPEIRLRASAVLARIEGNLLVQPTFILMDFDNQTILDVVQTINRRSGTALQLASDVNSSKAFSRITLRSAEPLSFWKGIDALCDTGGLHYSLMASSGSGPRESVFPIYPGSSPRPEPVSDHGPFRTHLASIHYQSEIELSSTRPTLSPKPQQPGTFHALNASSSDATRQFYLQGVVATEPRLSIVQNGAVQVIEAIDDRDHSLIRAANQSTQVRSSGYFGMNPSPFVCFRVDLAYPESASRRIKRLKGTMPVIVATRKPDPLKVALDGSTGKRFQSSDVALTVGDIKSAQSGKSWTIELTLQPILSVTSAALQGEADPMVARLEPPQQQLEILDERNEPIPWFPSSSLFNGEETRLTLSLILTHGATRKPTTIAYHGMIRAATDVPFEFNDVPIP